MLMISAATLLNAWEVALTQPPVERALTLLTWAWPDRSATAWAAQSIGQRDGALLTLREQLFGPRLNSSACCPQCGERLELSFLVEEIRAPMPEQNKPALQLQSEEYLVQFRLPTSTDLIALADIHDLAVARQQLLQRCLVSGQPVDKPLPAHLIEQVLAQMTAADPQGDVELALTCPNCQYQWQLAFDILSYLWTEIHDWAQRTLREVHLLATAYGWCEADILALSAARRQLYLALLGN